MVIIKALGSSLNCPIYKFCGVVTIRHLLPAIVCLAWYVSSSRRRGRPDCGIPIASREEYKKSNWYEVQGSVAPRMHTERLEARAIALCPILEDQAEPM